jgi:hypothetical protein
MGEPIRCRVLVDSDYKKPGHLRVGLVCTENSAVIVGGKKQIQQRIVYDWGATLVENKPLEKKSYYDVVFHTPNTPELQLAYPPSHASKGRIGKVVVAWAWHIFALFSKPVRESGEMAWLMENMPERLREETGLTEEDREKVVEASQPGLGFVYNFSLNKDSSFERVSKPIAMNYAPSEVPASEPITAKFSEVGEIKAPSRYAKQGDGVNLVLKVWNPTPKPGRVGNFRGVVECWNAHPATAERVGGASFILKDTAKLEPGETLEIPLKTLSISGPPTIYGKDVAFIWTCRMEIEPSWLGKEYAALSFHLLPSAMPITPKKIKLFKFQPLFTDSNATDVPFCEILAKVRSERVIPALRSKMLEILPQLWLKQR